MVHAYTCDCHFSLIINYVYKKRILQKRKIGRLIWNRTSLGVEYNCMKNILSGRRTYTHTTQNRTSSSVILIGSLLRYYFIDWLIDWLVVGSVTYFIGWLINLSINKFALIHRLTYWLTDLLVDWLISWKIDWLTDSSVTRSTS